MRFLLPSFLLLILFACPSYAIWPFDYWSFGEMEDPFPVLSIELGGSIVSLDKLNNDILHVLCALVHGIEDKAHDDAKTPNGPAMPGQYPPDVREQHISALRSLSMTNKHFRNLTSPLLFKSIKIDGNWKEASRGLQLMENCPAALEQARTFKFQVYETGNGKAPPPDLDRRLLSILERMDTLSALHLSIPEFHTDKFSDLFSANALNMPNVRTLVLGSYNDFIIRHCPSVQAVSTISWEFLHSQRGRYDNQGERLRYGVHAKMLVENASKVNNLSHFEMIQNWSEFALQDVLLHMPKIKCLGMPGGWYDAPLDARLDETYSNSANETHDLLTILAQFMNMEELILAGASNLHVGFDPPGCGNAYMGPDGEEYLKQVQNEGRQAEERVARYVFQACASLKKLWVGDWSRAEVVRDNQGNVTDVKWHYEERLAPSDWTNN